MNQKTISLRKKLETGGILGILFVLIIIGGILIFAYNNQKPKITINHDNFHPEIGYDAPILELNEKIDFSSIIITEKINGKTEQIKVTEEMIVSCDDTTTPGKKHLVIKHKHKEITIEFYVKYKVEFVVDGNVVSTQLIDDMSKFKIPSDPIKQGYEFTGWFPTVPEVITDNFIFVATFTDQPKEIPLLGELNATYGDTLGKFTLPKNEYGAWIFVDELTTLVGSAGENIFQVKFIPTNSELKELTSEVKINVSKKQLEFKNLVTSFIYDGNAYKPVFDIDVENLNIEFIGNEQINVGTYNYMYIINDENYEGMISGTFEILKPGSITITVDDIEIDYGSKMPEITYSVIGIDDISLLEIEQIIPTNNNVGVYKDSLTVKVNNDNYDVIVIPGTLTINSINLFTEEELALKAKEIKLDLEIINPATGELKPIAYLDKLGDLKIKNNDPNGYYTWDEPEYVFETVGKHIVKMVFTPNSNNYNIQELEYEINVEKKKLNINILENIYTYTGSEYTIKYLIEDGNYQDLEVTGNKTEINAGYYPTTLSIKDENYQGSVDVRLEILRATPVTDFTIEFNDVYWNSKLSDIVLPENYYWVNPSEILSTVGNNQTFNAVYDNGNLNYNRVNGTFTINVIKQVSSISALEKYEFTYDGTDVLSKLNSIVQSHNESSYQIYLENNVITELINAGRYELTIKLPESEHYQEATYKTIVNIAKFIVESPRPYNAIYKDLLSSLELPTSDYGTWSWNYEDDQTVGDTGTNLFVARFTPIDSNYEELLVEVEVTVSQKLVTIEIVNSRFTYDGNIHYLEYKVLDGELDVTEIVKITGNTGRTNAGSSVCNLIIDDKNYKGNLAATIYVDKANPVIEWPKVEDVKWNTTLSDVLLPDGFSWVSNSTFNPYNEKLTTIGEVTYQVLYNKRDDNYNIIYQDITFDVVKLESSVTALSKYTFVYDGSAKDLTDILTSHNESQVQFIYEKDGLVYESLRNEGTYNVTIILPESDHYNESSFTTVVVIEKASVEFEPIEYDAIYGQTLKDIDLPKNPYGVWNWENPELAVGNVGTNEFKAIFTPTDLNYKENSKIIKVHVAKKLVNLTITKSTFVYNGLAQSIEYKVFDEGNDITDLVEITGNVSLTNVGNKKAKLSISADNYYSNEISVTLVIEKADYTPKHPENLQAIYGDNLDKVILNNPTENIEGVWSWVEIKNVGTVGTNTFVATFIPTSNNYNSYSGLLNVEVVKKELTIQITNDTYTYANQLFKLEYVLSGFVNGDQETTIIGNDGLIDAGSKEFTLEVLDDNYCGSIKHTLIINKARVDEPKPYNATYYDLLEELNLPESEYGSWSWVDGDDTPLAFVGTKAIKAKFTALTDGNYESYETEVFVTTTKRLLTFINIVSSFVYDGTSKTVIYELNGFVDGLTTSDVLVTGNSVQNIVGSQELTLVVSNNYYYSEPINVTLEVTKAIPDVTFDKLYEIEWFDGITLNSIKLDNNFVWINPTTSLEVGESQEFEVKYVPTSANYQEVYGTYKVTVNKITPIISYDGAYSFIYDGNDIDIESYISHNNKDLDVTLIVKYYVLVDDNYVDVNVIHNAGEYKVVVILAESMHYNKQEFEFNYVVEKRQSVTNPLDERLAIYGQKLKELAEFPIVDDGTWAWENPEEYVGNVGEKTFKAVFTPTDTNILPTMQDVVVKVSPKEIKFENVISTFDYSGNNHFVTYKLSEEPSGISVEVTGTTSMIDYIEGGKPFTLTIVGNDNYYGYYEGTMVINRIDPEYGTVPTFTAIYGDRFEDIIMPNHELGKWSINNVGLVGNHGIYTNIELVFTPFSSNYNEVIVLTTLTVDKADSTITNNLPSELIYTGNNLNIENYFTLNHNETALLFNGTTKVEVIDAKKYTITISANETSNYHKTSITVDIIVNPATPDIKFDLVFDNIPYGTILNSIELPEGYSWIDKDIKLTKVESNQEFSVIFTPTDSNYHSVTGTFTVNVIKANANVTADDITRTYEKDFNVLSLLNVNTTHQETSVELYLENNKITTLTNVGSYSLTVKLLGNENYNEATCLVNITINKARVDVPSPYTTIYGSKLEDLTLPTSEFGIWSWNALKDESTGNVGTNIFNATFTSTDDNYESYQTMVSVNVEQLTTVVTSNIPIDLSYNENNFNYKDWFKSNHSDVEIEYIIKLDGIVVDNISSAGNYSITVIIPKTDNTTEFQTTIEFSVARSIYTPLNIPTNVEASYGDELSKITINNHIDNKQGTWTINTTGVIKDIKTYSVSATFTPYDTNYLPYDTIINVTAVKKVLTIKIDKHTFDYDGSNHVLEYTIEGIIEGDEEPNVLGNDGLINAGSKEFTLTIESDYYQGSVTQMLKVNQVDPIYPELSSKYTTYKGLTLENTLDKLESNEVGSWVFEDPSKVVDVSGLYPVKFVPNSPNYNIVVGHTVYVEIIQKETILTKNVPSVEELVYTGDAFDFESWFTINHTYSELSVILVGGITEIRNAGTYQIKVSLEENEYCTSLTEEIITVTISKASHTLNIPTNVVGEYGDDLTNVNVINPDSNIEGVWTITSTGKIEHTGQYQVNATFTPVNANYESYEVLLNIIVNKKHISIIITEDTFDYDGAPHTLGYTVSGIIENESEDRIPIVLGNGEITNVDENNKVFTLYIEENDYYELLEVVNHSITIKPVKPVITAPVYDDSFYEGRFDISTSYLTAPNATFNNIEVDGTFTYPNNSDVYYGAGQSKYQNAGFGYLADSTDNYGISSTFTITFTPNSTNFIENTAEFNIMILPVAFNGSYYYGTLEKALKDAGGLDNSGTTVEVIVGSNPIIKENVTINSGITLLIPYEQGVANSTLATSNTFEDIGVIATEVIIDSNIVLTNNGTIEIGGILSGGAAGSPYSGHTADKYTQITMNANSQLVSTGLIRSFGYIKESSLDNGSKVVIQSGEIYAPFVVRDFKGGSASYALYQAFDTHHATPFNQFEVRNITSTLEIQYNGKLYGFANLFADSKNHESIVSLVGNGETDKKYVIEFTNEEHSFLRAKYNSTTEIIDIDIYGGAATNPMSLKLKVLTDINISTQSVYFPISWQYDISLNKGVNQNEIAEYSIPLKIKIMPGATLKVSEGTKLNVTDNLIVYSSYSGSMTNVDGNPIGTLYPSIDKNNNPIPGGKLIINGQLIAKNLAGVVLTEVTGARLEVAGSASFTAYEGKVTSGSSLLAKITAWTNIEEDLELVLYKGGSTPKKSISGTYLSREGAWYSLTCGIKYDAMGGTLTGNESEGGDYPTGDTGYTITSINTTDPIRKHYVFDGWYIDEDCTIPAVGQVIYSNVYVYAKWIPIEYDLVYEITNETNDIIDYVHPSIKITVETYEDSLESLIYGNYVFDGWYSDSGKTNRILSFKASDYLEQIESTGKITIYGSWLPSDTEKYTLSFVTNNPELVYEDQIVISTKPTAYSLPNLSAGNDDILNPKYFVGWYTDEECTEGNEFVEGTVIDKNTILYAKWEDKIAMTIYFVSSIPVTLYYRKGEVNLPDKVPTAVKELIPNVEIDSNETAVYFTSENKNSSDFYTGGRTYQINENLTLYVDFYYVIDSTIYANGSYKTIIVNHKQVLFYKVDFTNENIKIDIEWQRGLFNATPSRKETNSNFEGLKIEKLLLEDCTGIHANPSGVVTSVTESSSGYLGGSATATAYNGLFADCGSLKTVIVKGSTELKDHMFANCSSLTTIITSTGQISDISKYTPKDSGV